MADSRADPLRRNAHSEDPFQNATERSDEQSAEYITFL